MKYGPLWRTYTAHMVSYHENDRWYR